MGDAVWPSGKGLGSIPLRLPFLFEKVVVCGQSRDFVPHNE